jgi:hypothetical protein
VLRRVEAWAGEEAGVLELVRKLGCLPLAIEQAAAFAREYKDSMETPAQYLAEQVSADADSVQVSKFDSVDCGTAPWSFVMNRIGATSVRLGALSVISNSILRVQETS